MEENIKPEGEQINSSIEKDPTKIHIEKNPATALSNWMAFIRKILSIKDGVILFSQVVKQAEESVIFKGYNVWILICSIIIASVGLNVDSTAVVVGAMLISPLMGPIRGVGFGVGTNDLRLIRLSLKNFGITVGVSLLTSTIYFFITPIDQLTTQIFLRTEPNFLDVIIAFTGGLAGVIAAVKGKNDTVIPGVAIATALMPPLCTAGYGLAHGEWNYFLGASYLFLINSVLITLSTILIVRYLNFPKHEYVDVKVEKKVKNSIVVFMVVILAPSAYLFYTMIQRTVFENSAIAFVKEIVQPSAGSDVKIISNYGYEKDSTYIDINLTGAYVGKDMIKYWNREKSNEKYDLGTTFLNIFQGEDISGIKGELDLINKNAEDTKYLFKTINEKDKKISDLTEKYELLEKESTIKDPMDFNYLLNSFRIDYPEFYDVKINRGFGINASGVSDTTYAIFVKFKPDVLDEDKESLKYKVSKRLKFELESKTTTRQDSIPVIVY